MNRTTNVTDRIIPRGGFSLLEVIVSLGLFTALLVGITQALIATRNYVGEDEIRGDLELEGLRLMRELSADLGNSAWFLNAPGSTFPNEPEPKLVSPQTYPNVGKGPVATSLGTSAWGDQIDFVKLRLKDGIWISPNALRNASTTSRFNMSTTNAVAMQDIFGAPTLISLISNPDWLPGAPRTIPFVWPVFESAVAPLTYLQNAGFNTPGRSPRLYRYIVRAQAANRNGRLVRQYSNGPGSDYAAIPEYATHIEDVQGGMVDPPPVSNSPNPWVDDVVLTDNIKATDDPDFPDLIGTPGVRFDTFLTDRNVRNNEIRIRLILVRRPSADTSGIRVKRIVQTSIAMRSVTY
jgi:type II secretory pathway pseudopilin PulG